EPVEQNDRAVRPQSNPPGGIGDIDGDLHEERRGDLARDRPLPDQLVKAELLPIEMAGDIGGPAREVGRPDRFVRFLSVLGGAAGDSRRIRHVTRAEFWADKIGGHGDNIGRNNHAEPRTLKDAYRTSSHWVSQP